MSKYFPTDAECGHHEIFGNVQIATLAGDHLQFSIADIPDKGGVPEHSHINEQMGIILSGELDFTIGDERKRLKPGELYRIPGGVPHAVYASNGPVKVLDVFYPIRDEYR